jgi:hypothetical protein
MPVPYPSPDLITELALTLAAFEYTRRSLEQTAPATCAEHGGAEAIMLKLGGRMAPHAKGWWSVDFTTAEGQMIHSQMMQEQQRRFRECGE